MRLFLLLFIAFLFSCSQGTGRKNPAGLNDSLFALKNVPDTRFTANFFYDKALYADSTKKVRFTELDSTQKRKWLAALLDIDSNYIARYMSAYFISIQEPVNGFTPILVQLDGDDYSALHYILINQDNKPVSQVIVHGGEYDGPGVETDSTITMAPQKQSFFKGNQIDSYALRVCESIAGHKRPDIIDSITYRSVIDASGKISTTRLDSVRYRRKEKIQN